MSYGNWTLPGSRESGNEATCMHVCLQVVVYACLSVSTTTVASSKSYNVKNADIMPKPRVTAQKTHTNLTCSVKRTFLLKISSLSRCNLFKSDCRA